MKVFTPWIGLGLVAQLILGLMSGLVPDAYSKNLGPKEVKRRTEQEVRTQVEPVLNRYCKDQCKLLGVEASIDLSVDESLAPGFDDMGGGSSETEVVATGVRVKILMDESIGSQSRNKFTELVQKHLEGLEYPVSIDTTTAHFPQPLNSAAKIAELRERATKSFRDSLQQVLTQVCPDQCILAELDVKADPVNIEEAQYGASSEFLQEGDTAIRLRNLTATVLLDDALPEETRQSILEMANLRTSQFRNVTIKDKVLKFPDASETIASARSGKNGRKLASTSDSKDSKESRESKEAHESRELKDLKESSELHTKTTANTQNQENNTKQERFERIEKIERVESGDAVQAELKQFKVFGLIFACSVLSLLIFIAVAGMRPAGASSGGGIQRIFQTLTADPTSTSAPSTYQPKGSSGGSSGFTDDEKTLLLKKRYEIEQLESQLMGLFAEQPKVAKQVFSRILTEEGVETTARYIHIFGESVVIDMVRDPSLQNEVSEMMEFYGKNPEELKDDEKLDLLRKLYNRAIAAKLFVTGNRSSTLFEYLSEMDGRQILELIKNESLTVKAIILTQVDPQKRSNVYMQFDEDTRMRLLTELSRLDHLPKAYIQNVGMALKRKRLDNPRLNTEALPGSEVLVGLLERTGMDLQRHVIGNLETSNAESARTVKSRLVSIDTLRYLRDGQLLEVILGLKHEELVQFLKAAPEQIRNAIFSKCPKDLVMELGEEIEALPAVSREGYMSVERKVLSRIKTMANEGNINLLETNERMFSDLQGIGSGGVLASAPMQGGFSGDQTESTSTKIERASGW